MSSDKQIKFLEEQQVKQPRQAARYHTFADLYQRKLWHQLTLALQEAIADPDFTRQQHLIPLFENFISSFAHRLNLLSLAKIGTTVARQYSKPSESVSFVERLITQIKEAKLPRTEQPLLYLQMEIGYHKLQEGQLPEAKKCVESGREQLEAMQDVDPVVSAHVHYVSSLYWKRQQDFAEFYKSSLMYLAFVPVESLATDLKKALGVDIALAALLGANVYGFGELLLHPIAETLKVSEFQWLYDLLVCFNKGDLHQYEELCMKHADKLNAQPALVENERKLREKITILCLLELIARLPAESRSVSLGTIAKNTKLSQDGVEFLLMKTLSLHLIEGSIDQVGGTVQVSWVQPRVLTHPQMEDLKGRLDGWITKVNSAALSLEEESVGLAES